eukprot:CAMPEP_0202088742 /NCGR_PEP_ID=MMETSP0964-20121228/39364_1 /ASSEMBLY_ACC=CAM_ASM_000500 /TAXON_ID=4773 /ORGANISM="Schizochytrium aggregatum, Strain ATCC28209" /LENGTH=753 /DNA_ID=CAMNT_0048656775 /DNA_START=34 /DNA_END=2295 /DNA_ORIENTATION=-
MGRPAKRTKRETSTGKRKEAVKFDEPEIGVFSALAGVESSDDEGQVGSDYALSDDEQSGGSDASEDEESEEDEGEKKLAALEERRREPRSVEEWYETPSAPKLPIKGEGGELQLSEHQVAEQREKLRKSLGLVYTAKEREEQAEQDAKSSSDRPLANQEQAGKNKRKKKEADEPAVLRNAAGLMLMREEKKLNIARCSEELISDPETGLASGEEGGSSMNFLLNAAAKDEDKTIRKLALLSLVAIFRDILPEYRINESQLSADKGVKLKKEVRKLRVFERSLLQTYQRFLTILHQNVKSGLGSLQRNIDHREDRVSARSKYKCDTETLISIRGFCTLLANKSHFNFRENLLANVVPCMNSPVEQVRKQCCSCISTMLQEDITGDVTLEVVILVSNLVKSAGHGLNGTVHPDVCKVLLYCDLKSDLKDVRKIEEMKKEREERKKKRKTRDDIIKSLEEAEGIADKYRKHGKNIEALKELFVMYLRVVKRAPSSELLPVVLKGIARYVHLINLDIAQALVAVLTDLIRSDTVTLKAGLQSVHTVAMTLRGPGIELNVDESEYVAYLYRGMLRLITSMPDRDEYVPILIRAIEAVFLGRKLFQHNRVAAVVTRLSILATFCSPHAILALVSLVRQLMTRYAGACRPLLDGECDVGEGGNSLSLGLPPPDDDNIDPVLVQADTGALWPLAQLRFHYHPFVRTFVEGALKMSLLMPNERPFKLFDAYNPYLEGGFKPAIPKTLNAISGKKRNRKGPKK